MPGCISLRIEDRRSQWHISWRGGGGGVVWRAQFRVWRRRVWQKEDTRPLACAPRAGAPGRPAAGQTTRANGVLPSGVQRPPAPAAAASALTTAVAAARLAPRRARRVFLGQLVH